jgi:hypothetical protein
LFQVTEQAPGETNQPTPHQATDMSDQQQRQQKIQEMDSMCTTVKNKQTYMNLTMRRSRTHTKTQQYNRMIGMTAADVMILFFTTLGVAIPTYDAFDDDYEDENDCNILHTDVVDQRSKGHGRGWGGVRSDGERYTKKDKIKHRDAPSRPKPKRKDHVRDEAKKLEEHQEGGNETYNHCDRCESYSSYPYSDYDRSERENNPMPPCTKSREAWALMRTSSTTFEKIYAAHFGGFVSLGYKETFNVVSNVVMEWTNKNPIVSILAKQFISELFGPEYQMQRTPWIFTKGARVLASKLFGITTFHEKLKSARSFICVNRVKESCTQTGGYAIAFKEWRELLNLVDNPGELLRSTIARKINNVLDDTYLLWIQDRLLMTMH